MDSSWEKLIPILHGLMSMRNIVTEKNIVRILDLKIEDNKIYGYYQIGK